MAWPGSDPENIFNDPLPPTRGLMKCRKVKMSTCQLAGNVLLFLVRGNSAIREWQHDPTAYLRSLVYARMCSIMVRSLASMACLLQIQDTADFD